MNDPASETKTRLFHDEAPEGSDEPATSGLAVITLLLGLGSFFALASPVMWLAPIAAVITGAAALRSIAANPSMKRGRGLALVGLTLACLFGGMAPVRHWTRQQQLYREAIPRATQWFDLLRTGKLMEAHQLKMGFQERATADSDLVEHYKDSTKRMLYEGFTTTSPAAEIARWGEATQVRHASNVRTSGDSYGDLIVQTYDVGVDKDGREYWMTIEMWMMRRVFRETRETRWEVKDVKVVSLPPNIP